jgi:hypothetical protein
LLNVVNARTNQGEAAEALLHDTRPDELTPCEALDLAYRLKGLIAE